MTPLPPVCLLYGRWGQKVRVAGIQAPDFESEELCRHPSVRRLVCAGGNTGACSDQRIISLLTRDKRLVCEMEGKSFKRVVAQRRLANGRSLSCTATPLTPPFAGMAVGGATRW